MIFLINTGKIRVELSRWREIWRRDPRYFVEVKDSQGKPVESNRNGAALHFLRSGCDYMVQVDDDTVPVRNPLDLVEEDLDIVVFPTPMWRPEPGPGHPIYFNIELLERPAEPGPDKSRFVLEDPAPLEELATGGAGCLLVARRVLEHPDMRAPFKTVFNDFGITMQGEDINFVHRARAAGFRAWAAMQYPCSHVKEMELLGVHDLIRRSVTQAEKALTDESFIEGITEAIGKEAKVS
jgi:hypothetical protein